MLSRAARSVAITWLAAVACGTEQSTPDSPRSRALEAAPDVAFAIEAAAPTGASAGTDCPTDDTAAPGEPLWLQSFDAAQIITVASDATGMIWMTRSGGQTRLSSPSGELLWSRPWGERVVLGSTGEAFVAGSFSGRLALGAVVLQSRGERDVYVARVSDAGDVVSAFAIGGSEDDALQSLARDSGGNLLLSGAGIGTRKVTAEGAPVWEKSFVGKLAIDSTDSVWLTGALSGAQDFGGGSVASQGGDDVFLVKLSSGGDHLYSHAFGDAGALQRGEGIAVDAADDVIVTGTFDGTLDFGAGALVRPSDACSADAWCQTFGFATKLDRDGNPRWSRAFGAMRELGGVATGPNGGVALTGALPGGVRPFRETWLTSLDAEGSARWSRAEWPATGVGRGIAIAAAPCGQWIWALSARPSFDIEAGEQSYIAAIAP